MNDDTRDVAERLARLAAATEGVRPRAGFDDRVMEAITAERVPAVISQRADWLVGVVRSSRLALTAATLLAVGAVVLAVQSQRAYDTEAAIASTAVEVGW